MELTTNDDGKNSAQIINNNNEKTKEIKLNGEQILNHKMLKKIKNPVWNKFNY